MTKSYNLKGGNRGISVRRKQLREGEEQLTSGTVTGEEHVRRVLDATVTRNGPGQAGPVVWTASLVVVGRGRLWGTLAAINSDHLSSAVC